MPKHSHFETPPENPSVQTHLVVLCCIKRLCIFRPKGAILHQNVKRGIRDRSPSLCKIAVKFVQQV